MGVLEGMMGISTGVMDVLEGLVKVLEVLMGVLEGVVEVAEDVAGTAEYLVGFWEGVAEVFCLLVFIRHRPFQEIVDRTRMTKPVRDWLLLNIQRALRNSLNSGE